MNCDRRRACAEEVGELPRVGVVGELPFRSDKGELRIGFAICVLDDSFDGSGVETGIYSVGDEDMGV